MVEAKKKLIDAFIASAPTWYLNVWLRFPAFFNVQNNLLCNVTLKYQAKIEKQNVCMSIRRQCVEATTVQRGVLGIRLPKSTNYTINKMH